MSAPAETVGGVVIIAPGEKRLTARTGLPAVRRAHDDAIREGKKNVALDFSGVEFIDDATLGFLIDAFKSVHRNNGRLCVFGATEDLRELMANTVIAHVVEIVSDRAAAIRVLKSKKWGV